MKKSEWSDKQLEDLLRRMPKMLDRRDPRDIYQNIAIKANKRRRRFWIMPGLATAAALILFLILAPNLMNWQQSEESVDKKIDSSRSNSIQMDVAENKSEMEMQTQNEVGSVQKEQGTSQFKADKETSTEQFTAKMADKGEFERSAVYEEDLAGKDLLTYAIPDANVQNIVPVSILVKKEENKTWFDQFKETMPDLQEEEWGLSDYYPLQADLEYDPEQKVVKVDVPADHPYSMGTTAEVAFTGSLAGSFSMQEKVEKIKFFTDKKEGILFEHGEVTEIPVKPAWESKRGYLLFYPGEGEKSFMVPSPEQYETIEEAFAAMRLEIKPYQLKPSLPEELQFEKVKPDNGILTIYFAKNTKLSQNQDMVYSFEAILLAAKDFGYKAVKIENPPVENIGPFNLAEELEVPVAANKRAIQE